MSTTGALSAVPTVLTLSSWQNITSFTAACMTAYNTPLTSCIPSDFAPTTPCSTACGINLEGVSVLIQKACQNANAPSDSLLGLFITSKGVGIMCPNFVDGINSGGTSSIFAPTTPTTSESLPASTWTFVTASMPVPDTPPPNTNYTISDIPTLSASYVPNSTETTSSMLGGNGATSPSAGSVPMRSQANNPRGTNMGFRSGLAASILVVVLIFTPWSDTH